MGKWNAELAPLACAEKHDCNLVAEHELWPDYTKGEEVGAAGFELDIFRTFKIKRLGLVGHEQLLFGAW
ncbi:hypothetical protein CRT23_24020 [Methylobacterium sp. V23]|nr:hypothetical protein CRT23_24020 [Methylobacterium sp. V23]